MGSKLSCMSRGNLSRQVNLRAAPAVRVIAADGSLKELRASPLAAVSAVLGLGGDALVLLVQLRRGLLQRAPTGAGPRPLAPAGADILRSPGGHSRAPPVESRDGRAGRARERGARVQQQ
jgi:hypothetical protein